MNLYSFLTYSAALFLIVLIGHVDAYPKIEDICLDVICPGNHVCIPDIKNCFTEPCPQHFCQDISVPCIVSGCSQEICGEEEIFSPCV